MSHDKPEALRRLEAAHREIRRGIGLAEWPLVTAEQVHGNRLVVLMENHVPQMSGESGDSRLNCFPGCDGIITTRRELLLGIHVADCCAVYIVDPKTPAIGLVHSGKKGTELGIASKAIDHMKQQFGSNPPDMIVQLSPCIRPPHYEIDFAAEIVRQCRSSGVNQIHDSGACTACDVTRYYSYRAEKGKTGRMLALLALI